MDSLPTPGHLGLSCCSKLHQIQYEFLQKWFIYYLSDPHPILLNYTQLYMFLFPDVVCNHCDITKSANKGNIFFVFSLQHY